MNRFGYDTYIHAIYTFRVCWSIIIKGFSLFTKIIQKVSRQKFKAIGVQSYKKKSLAGPIKKDKSPTNRNDFDQNTSRSVLTKFDTMHMCIRLIKKSLRWLAEQIIL